MTCGGLFFFFGNTGTVYWSVAKKFSRSHLYGVLTFYPGTGMLRIMHSADLLFGKIVIYFFILGRHSMFLGCFCCCPS